MTRAMYDTEEKRKGRITQYETLIHNLEQQSKELSRTTYSIYDLGGLSKIEQKISKLKEKLALEKKGDK